MPSANEYEILLRLPFAIKYTTFEGRLDFIASLLLGFYYASFDHEYGIGGNNSYGWVPQIGMGLAMDFRFNSHASLQLGTTFIRIPELNSTQDQYTYSAQNISFASLFSEPLSISIRIQG